MVALFQIALVRFALCGLAVSLLLLALRSRIARDTFARLLSIWRSLTAFGRVAVCSFLLIGVLVGGDKTNNVPPNMNLPLPQMMQGGGSFQTGFTGLSRIGNLVNLVNPVQQTFAEKKQANWNVRGAWKDSFWLDFEDGWLFPHGTNHLSGVEVVSYGQVWATPFDTNAVASAGAPFEIVRGLTTFGCAHTPSNSYRFAWNDAALNRDTNALVSAALELFRNGDVAVTTNGVTTTTPRALPFPHNGFGQDAEWVAANFTNAAEILAVGYPNWVDAQVGEGLTNGLYKFTASFLETPPEATLLYVGDYSVCVTNAGDYVFILEKGTEYEFCTWPFNDDVEYSARDDMAPAAPVLRSWSGGWGAPGTWTIDGGDNWLARPGWGYPGYCCWLPTLQGSPDISHLGPSSDTMTFTALLSDYRYADSVAYHWSCEDGNVVIATPNARTTEISFTTMPSWRAATLSVAATVGTNTLCSTLAEFTYGTNETPQVHFDFSAPDAVLLNSNRTDNAKLRKISLSLSTDAEKSGLVRLSCTSGGSRIALWGTSNRTARVTLPRTWNAAGFSDFEAYVEGVGTSESLRDVRITAEYLPSNDVSCEIAQELTVVEVGEVSLPGAPADGLVVLRGTSVLFEVGCRPSAAKNLLSTIWETRRLRGDVAYDGWTLALARSGENESIYVPQAGGIYQVRVKAGVGGSGIDERNYSWADYSDFVHGDKVPGDLKAFGVCDAEWQKTVRNSAKAFLGSGAYAFAARIGAYGNFAAVKSRAWKCNIFVAHRLYDCGFELPAVHKGKWPPLANEWGDGNYVISGWNMLGSEDYLQPGMIAIRRSADGHGHIGILDFDGVTISAQESAVTRRSNPKNWNHAVFRTYGGSR